MKVIWSNIIRKHIEIYFLSYIISPMNGTVKKVYKSKFRRYRRKNYKKPNTKATKKQVQKIVKREIARNIENKYTGSVNIKQRLLSTNASSVPSYFVWSPQGDANILSTSQGTAQNQRIGNQLKIKRWVIKGTFQGPDGGTAFDDLQCIVKLYFMRQYNYQPITATLPGLYQDGGSVATPDGSVMQRLMPINKDSYKVYWSKTFKLGQSAAGTATGTSNNDFKLCPSFGFDVTKYVCKNKIVKYEDGATTPTDSLISSLTLVAVMTSQIGDITFGATQESAFSIAINSYIEYEDA